MSNFNQKPVAGVDYCGYCKQDINNGECGCNGLGHAKGTQGTCGYCHADYGEYNGVKFSCECDGFGGDPITHGKVCRYCSAYMTGVVCPECNQAQ